MNESINLAEILKDCPEGTEFYHAAYGRVWFRCINLDCSYPIRLSLSKKISDDVCVTSKGFLRKNYDGECLLFPSKYQRDWSKFSAPWYNTEKQDEDKKERNNFDVLPGLYKCVHRMFDGTPDGRLLFEIGNVYKCLSKHDRAEFEVSYGHSVYLEDPVVCKYFIPFESKVEQTSSQINERAWLYLVSDVLTWKDGIGQYLDDTRVQELAKRLCSEYAQKLYSPSNSSNTRKNEQKSADKIEPKFKVGDWVVDNCGYVWKIEGTLKGILNQFYLLEGVEGDESRPTIDWADKTFHFWTFQDAKDGDVVQLGTVTAIFKKYIGEEKCICYCSFCKDGGFEIPIENGDDNVYGCYNGTPATKEQRYALMKTMNDAGYEWDIEKKELKKLVPNRFDPNTLQPFDKVLVRRGSENYNVWFADFVAEPSHTKNETPLILGAKEANMVIPYNDETKHLVGTTEEAPEYYRYWED